MGVGTVGNFVLSAAFDDSTARGAAATVVVMQLLLPIVWAWSVIGALWIPSHDELRRADIVNR